MNQCGSSSCLFHKVSLTQELDVRGLRVGATGLKLAVKLKLSWYPTEHTACNTKIFSPYQFTLQDLRAQEGKHRTWDESLKMMAASTR